MTKDELLKIADTAVDASLRGSGKILTESANGIEVLFTKQTIIGKRSIIVVVNNGKVTSIVAQG